ncbi:MAG: Txe/YoeB family addiction module toxin [Firmicutes bacterium]|nr:Txe/YoeB family addiction module toxin [Bacillota bacterium]
MSYKILFSKEALKGLGLLAQKKSLLKNASNIVEILKVDPYQNPPPFEKLLGDLTGCFSRRINIQHRLVYSVDESAKEVLIHSVWSHYEF